MNRRISLKALATLIVFPSILWGCGNSGSDAPNSGGTEGASASKLTGEIKIDGSSTVYPISQAYAEEFMKLNDGVKISVGESGTTAGFQKFMEGSLDIAGASRPIDDKEIAKAKEAGIEFVELPIAYDGLSLVVNPKNTWCDTLTVAELAKIWGPGSTVNNWKDVRPGFPDKPLKLFGAGEASGTFDYFNEAINGSKKKFRSDYSKSEDDNTLVQGVSGEEGGLAYFGFSYYVNNKDIVKIVKIDGGAGPIEPTETTINDGTYQPLSRPLFIYINKKSIDKPEVMAFVKYALGAEGQELVKSSGYVTLPTEAYALIQARAEKMTVGSAFAGKPIVGVKIADLLKNEGG